ncbi:MAG: T9SS type A sorting domain-containing protein, partial [Melioribacteraceae bacterium]|nr:T9SS type A sorting domain-containing protein [Melioribacteraceae bacterium]
LSFWMNDFDVSYSASSPAYVGAEKGFPAGDLNAFPDKYAEWLVTDVELVDDIIPNDYTLEQNYPNPFNPSTTIRYQLPSNSVVKISVYNMLGELVRTMVNEYQSAGRYEVTFNASNLASGIYFYNIQAGDFVNTKKMLLLK